MNEFNFLIPYCIQYNSFLSNIMLHVYFFFNFTQIAKQYKFRQREKYILLMALHITDPEAYYYTTGTLNSLHETERFEDGTKRFRNGTKRFGDGTKRFGNGMLCIFGDGTLCTLWPRFQFSPIFGLPRMANRLFFYLRNGKMRIKVYLIKLDPLVRM